MALVNSQDTTFSPSSPVEKCNYDVFLSFRGADTRKHFTDHLYTALKEAGVQTFRDDDEIERGEYINSKLERAIKGSTMSVIVFSKDYACSKACLNEVETILGESKKSEHKILPVFYHIDPFEIKQQARAMTFLATDEKQKGWAAALKEVAGIAGMNLVDQYESTFIHDIIRMVVDKLIPRGPKDIPNLVGMESRTKKINLWLKDRSKNVSMLVICGMGGVGKTTSANFVFHLNRNRFDGSSFIKDIREASKDQFSLIRLQGKLLDDILGKKDRKILSLQEGLEIIRFSLRYKRVLLVFDDVDDLDKLNEVFGSRSWLFSGSKIIITTRNKNLMRVNEIYEVHMIEKLDNDESLELFCTHAFGQSRPLKDFAEHSKRIAYHCQGLPLALKVLGSSLAGRKLDLWEHELKKLEEIPATKILDKLKISYESLEHRSDRNLFLDIACFFVGKNKYDTTAILSGCGYHAAVGIQNLIDRNLLTTDEGDKLRMHQLLQDMGRYIVSQESDNPEDCSRVWHNKKSYDILRQKSGKRNILGLVLDMDILTKSTEIDEEVLETVSFQQMSKLRLLKMSYVKLSGTYKVFPKALRWLYWRGSILKSLPCDLSLENVVVLDMRNSNLEQAWKQTKVLKALKILNLSHSCYLCKTPDFSSTPNLEKLILKDCQSLIEINQSIVNLKRLTYLNLKDCRNLKNLPRNISMVKSLEELEISGCSNLVGAGEELVKMNLTVLRINKIPIKQALSHSSVSAPWYKVICPGSWFEKPLEIFKISASCLPRSLITLSLMDCNISDDFFPKDMGGLPSLQYLYLGENPISHLPDFIKDLPNLKKLDLYSCPKLQRIQWPSITIEELNVSECRLLETITYETWKGPKGIQHGACVNLDYVQSGFKIEAIKNINVQLLNNIGFFKLESQSHVEAIIVNTIVWSRKTCPIQVLYECGIFSTYFPEKEVPRQFSNRITGSQIVFTVPSSSDLRIRGMNMCVVYTLPEGCLGWTPIPVGVKIFNVNKQEEETYTPRCYGVPEANGHMVWLSHWLWTCWGPLFDEEDVVEISFILNVGGGIKECGFHLLYYQDEEDENEYYNNLYSLWDQRMDIFGFLELLQSSDNDDSELEERNKEEKESEQEETDDKAEGQND